MTYSNTAKRVCLAVLCLALCAASGSARDAAPRGEHEQRIGESLTLLNVFPGLRRTSVPVSIVVDSPAIPDGAIVESVSVVTGRVEKGNRATALNVVESYNLLPPGKEVAVAKKWAGARLPTTFVAGELGGAPIPAKGVWRLSMTGSNVGRTSATTVHRIVGFRIAYRVPEK